MSLLDDIIAQTRNQDTFPEFARRRDLVALETDLSNLLVNVKTYGAKGDNITNDTAAIVAAIAAAKTGNVGGTVFFPPGTYLTDPITDWAYGLEFAGAGPEISIVKSRAGGHVFDYSAAGLHTISWRDLGITVDSGAGSCIHFGAGLPFLYFVEMSRLRLKSDLGPCVLDEEAAFSSIYRHVFTNSNTDHWDVIAGNTCYFDGCYWGTPLNAGKIGFKIRAGSPYFHSCNGGHGDAGCKWAEIGSTSFGAGAFDHCNIEDMGDNSIGVDLLNGSYATFVKGTTFQTGDSVDMIAIKVANSAGGTSFLDPTVRFFAGPGNWKNGEAIHCAGPNMNMITLGDSADVDTYRDTAGAVSRGMPMLKPGSIFDPGGGRYLLAQRLQIDTLAHTGIRAGFFGTVATTKPAAPPADASDLATAIALVNNLKAGLITLGLR